jgi:hypothetical protein
MHPGTYPFFAQERHQNLLREADARRQADLVRHASKPPAEDRPGSPWRVPLPFGAVRRLMARLTAA